MCGIGGYIGKQPLAEDRIKLGLRLMENRGPDHKAFVKFESARNFVCLLHTRLSIIDLDDRSNQPFRIKDKLLVFNGEIYNYLELRKKLEEHGVSLLTQSDTEVLLQCYLLFGTSCIELFEGMWAFGVFDLGKGSLLLARDRFGEKPLYYLCTADGFYFASEVKVLAALSGRKLAVNNRQILRYLVNGYKALYKQPENFFEEVQEVPRASMVSIDQGLEKTVFRYWSAETAIVDMSFEQAVEGFKQLLFESLQLRMRADVPLAFCLSGGVDSAALVSIAARGLGCKVHTFSIIDQDPRYNEHANIMATVNDLGCSHEIIVLSQDQSFLESLKRLISYRDAPVATLSYYVHSLLSQAIAKAGYKVVLSGTAADELLTGYYDHFLLHLYEMRDHPDYDSWKENWERYILPKVRNPYLANPHLYQGDRNFRKHIYLNNDLFASLLRVEFAEDFFEEHYSDSLLRNRMLNELFHESVPVVLHEDDSNSMMYSIENRSPYLDSRLFEFCYSIPPALLIRNGFAKAVLREALDGILNDQVRLDRVKRGFNASLLSLLDFNNQDIRRTLLSDSPIYSLVDREKVKPLLSLSELPNSYSKFLFNLINAKIFMEEYC